MSGWGGAGRRATASDISMPVARRPTRGGFATAGGIALRSRAARSPLRGRSLCGPRTRGSRRSPNPKDHPAPWPSKFLFFCGGRIGVGEPRLNSLRAFLIARGIEAKVGARVRTH